MRCAMLNASSATDVFISLASCHILSFSKTKVIVPSFLDVRCIIFLYKY
jgi:hypothetical protein